MAAQHAETNRRTTPLILLVPGHDRGGPGDWITALENERIDCQRVDLGMWDTPHRNTWVNKLNLAIQQAQQAGRPVVLVGHDLGCLAVAWWAEFERPAFGHPVIGALLVSPPDVDRPGSDPRLARFGACPRQPLPFKSFLVSSRSQTDAARTTARQLARDWGAVFADASVDAGHWPFDPRLLSTLLRDPLDAAAHPQAQRAAAQNSPPARA